MSEKKTGVELHRSGKGVEPLINCEKPCDRFSCDQTKKKKFLAFSDTKE